MDFHTVPVSTPSRAYSVLVGTGIVARMKTHLDGVRFPAHRVVVSSPRVWRLHGRRVDEALGSCPAVLVPDGERSKHLRTVQRIYDGLIRAGVDRGTGVVALGGGVIGDMAGLAAATFLRGVQVAQVPTTLLAQVDSAIGGKTGVNLREGKNLVGAFHQPSVVLVDPGFLVTLNKREYRAGLYEALKYGVACSADLFGHIERNLNALAARELWALMPTIAECCRIKAKVVGEDEREQGSRRVLNFGHTAGHAFEAVTDYRRFKHGEAVGLGMRVAVALARRRGALADRDADRFDALLARVGHLPTVADLDTVDLLAATERDKKVVGGRLHFVLPTGIGRVEIVTDVTPEELRTAFVAVGCRA